MRVTPARRFCFWLEIVVVLLVTGYGIVAARVLLDWSDQFARMFGMTPERGPRRWVLATTPLFAWWSFMVLAFELVPRERWRAWRRPGIVPGIAVVLFAVRQMIAGAVLSVRWQGLARIGPREVVFLCLPTPDGLQVVSHGAGFAVAAAWLALWVGGWWHPAPTWVDRAGRVLGCYWVVVFVIDPFYFSLV